MPAKVLSDLETYKLPALRQSGVKTRAAGPLIVLFSRSGFKQDLINTAAGRDDLRLVGLDELVRDLVSQ